VNSIRKEGYKDDYALSGFTTDKFPEQKTMEKSFKKYYSPSLILGTILNMLSEHENQLTYRAWAEKGLSVSIKDEKSGRVFDKLFCLEDQRPVLQYLLMALEKLCVLRI